MESPADRALFKVDTLLFNIRSSRPGKQDDTKRNVVLFNIFHLLLQKTFIIEACLVQTCLYMGTLHYLLPAKCLQKYKYQNKTLNHKTWHMSVIALLTFIYPN